MRDLERSICGCDYGSTGNTTRQEAERIAELLELRPEFAERIKRQEAVIAAVDTGILRRELFVAIAGHEHV